MCDNKWVKECYKKKEVPRCLKCNDLCKPEIVFFGEGLPARFAELKRDDLPKAKLLLVIGTSLAVAPVNGLVDEVHHLCPRVLINREGVYLAPKPKPKPKEEDKSKEVESKEDDNTKEEIEQPQGSKDPESAHTKDPKENDVEGGDDDEGWGDFLPSNANGFRFFLDDNYRDVFLSGNCDDECSVLCRGLGWENELQRLWKEFDEEKCAAYAKEQDRIYYN